MSFPHAWCAGRLSRNAVSGPDWTSVRVRGGDGRTSVGAAHPPWALVHENGPLRRTRVAGGNRSGAIRLNSRGYSCGDGGGDNGSHDPPNRCSKKSTSRGPMTTAAERRPAEGVSGASSVGPGTGYLGTRRIGRRTASEQSSVDGRGAGLWRVRTTVKTRPVCAFGFVFRCAGSARRTTHGRDAHARTDGTRRTGGPDAAECRHGAPKRR